MFKIRTDVSSFHALSRLMDFQITHINTFRHFDNLLLLMRCRFHASKLVTSHLSHMVKVVVPYLTEYPGLSALSGKAD